MATMISVHPDNPQERLITQAADVLKKGGIITYPTDTVYGIGCDIFDKQSIEKIFLLKGKSKFSPLSFICPDLKDISKYAFVSNQAYKIMRQLLPGPYTFVLKGTRLVPKLMITKRNTVGIRVPDNNICIQLLRQLGNPIVSTSASLKNDIIFTDPEEIDRHMGHALDLIIDGGILGVNPSSVIDLSEEPFRVLRKGKGDISHFQ
ncbi:MAG: L-threonylcarbamoyladenylate synthase [candidate division KSB1 bacterium]|jgi:tRNA threonylcarbamoyl adenosine modification protein (Sua5/YciO/YrdC/YwlC family)|nr:L-threonylcarbamoyladenylate synthase [candidate division KSB1 bacterium]